MRIWRPSVLTAHVVGAVIQQFLGMAVLIGVALAMGFRPNATAAEWIAAAGLLTCSSWPSPGCRSPST
ncbi:hypothetical protein [Actinomadura sp. KC06]|uniref:hypothetical protein n=1 Tax=Actinomadura sp. KC06 TaxID=2530369 RepID=UPI00269D8C7C